MKLKCVSLIKEHRLKTYVNLISFFMLPRYPLAFIYLKVAKNLNCISAGNKILRKLILNARPRQICCNVYLNGVVIVRWVTAEK